MGVAPHCDQAFGLATHRPVRLDPVLEAESGTLPDWLLLVRVLGELEDERTERRMRLSLRQVALSLTAHACIGRERREEHVGERSLLRHGQRERL